MALNPGKNIALFFCLLPFALLAQSNGWGLLPEAGVSLPLGDFKETNVFAGQGYQAGLHLDKMWGAFGLGLYGGITRNPIDFTNPLEGITLGPDISETEHTIQNYWQQYRAGLGPVLSLRLSDRFRIDLSSKLGVARFSYPDLGKFVEVGDPLNQTFTLFQTKHETLEKRFNPMAFSALRFNFRLSKRIDLSLAGNYLHVRDVRHAYSYLDADFSPGMTEEQVVEALRTAPSVAETLRCHFNSAGLTLGIGFQIGGNSKLDEEIEDLEHESPIDTIFSDGRPPEAVCANGNVEFGNFYNWNGYIGNYNGAKLFGYNNVNSGLSLSPVLLGNTPRISIVTQGTDQFVPIRKVYEGNYAVQLGRNVSGKEAERITYNLSVTGSNKDFRFNYAVVLENPSHPKRKNPFFWARVLYNGKVICETGRKTAGTGDKFFKPHLGFEYRNWDCVYCDLGNYVGKTVQVEFTVAGCAPGGHFGYAYIDGLCDEDPIKLDFQLNKEVYCLGESIFFDGSSTTGATSYFITIEESDAYYGRPNPSSEIIFSAQNQAPGQADLLQMANLLAPQFSFKCNTYYRIKLAVSNACNPWKEEVKLIYITCPDLNINSIHCLNSCADLSTNDAIIPLGPGTNYNYSYSWTPSIGLSASNIANPYHVVGSVSYPFVYQVTATDETGCTVKKDVKINCPPEFARIEQRESGDCCSPTRLVLMASNYNSVHWSNGAIDVDYIDINESGTYTVTITNECGSFSTSITVTTNATKYARYWTNLNDENNHHFYSSHNNNNSSNAFFIKNVEPVAPAYGEYLATHYKLEIYNRWGELIRNIEGSISNCKGFNNPSIFWDGTTSSGQRVQEGMYNGKLYLKNCRHADWVPVKVTIPNPYCINWDNDCRIRLNPNNRGPRCNPGKFPKKYYKCTQIEVGGTKKYIFPVFIFW